MPVDLSLARNAVLLIISFASFAAIHSLTASIALKQRLADRLGARWVEGWYRILYNIASVFTVAPTLALVVLLPDQTLYTLLLPWNVVGLVIQGAGIAGIVIALFSTDVWQFVGVNQALDYLSGKAVISRTVPLKLDGVYRLVRHPLYLFSLFVIWPVPVMTWNLLWFNLGATVYFALGSIAEERRLEQEYGDAYRKYRQQVPWLFPWPRR